MSDSFSAARRRLLAGDVSCQDLARQCLDRIEARNPELNAFIHVSAERTLAQAASVDARLAAGADLPLAGLMLGVKDVICEQGQPVRCASDILEGFESLIQSTALTGLTEAGAVVVGRTNCDEFAMGSSNENSTYGRTRHPLDGDLVTGGSSGGSAAAVAAGLCHVALGSDTGGSIRQPAAFCGVAGLKPTYGRVSRFGLVAYASSFDCIGPFARSIDDLACVMSCLSGRDERDNTSSETEVPDFAAESLESIEGLRVGIPEEYFGPGLDPETAELVRQATARLEASGAHLAPVSLPHTRYGIATYYILTTAEASSNLARYDGVRYGRRATGGSAQDLSLTEMYTQTRSEGFGPEVKRRIMLGTYVLSSGYYDAYYGKAQRVRSLVRQDFDVAFSEVDLIAGPATPAPAFAAGSKTDDPLAMYLSDVFTVPANLAGIPGLVVPAGRTSAGLPVGIQLLGPAFSEGRLMAAGRSAWDPLMCKTDQ